jgi:hypothetical protein
MDNNLKYKCLEYWNERYKDEETFEWFGEYAMFKSVLKQIITPMDKILVLGNFMFIYQFRFLVLY